jgi:hypothetical protein
LCWEKHSTDRSDAIADCFSSEKDWLREPDGDLAYLLEEYGFDGEESLLRSLGIEVIGNIYQSPKLLEAK